MVSTYTRRWWNIYCNRVLGCRIILAHVSSLRRHSRSRAVSSVRRDDTVYSRMELDSHADTIVLGKNCVELAYTGRECDMSPYTESYAAIRGVPIVSGATAKRANSQVKP